MSALLAAVAASGALPAMCGSGGLARASSDLDAPALAFDANEGAVVNRSGLTESLPSDFADEIGLPTGARNVACYGSEGPGAWVVGCSVSGEADAVLADLGEGLADKGWVEYPLGDAKGASFAKSAGKYRLAMVTCDQVGDDACIVMRVLGEAGEP